jgi:cytochrome oxidase Cu insertion factor (SCO1/SenC/PrrC family)
MRSRMLLAATLALGVLVAACSRQETPPTSEQGPIAVGQTAPAFSLKSSSGGTVSLSEYAGEPVLLYFSMGPG